MLNPNDLFTQIGFVIDSSPPKSSKRSRKRICEEENFEESEIEVLYESGKKQERVPEYVTSLEIELSEDENHLLQIKSYDDPFEIANKFCLQHNLNLLAVEVVEKKIIEAKRREELKIKFKHENKQQESKEKDNLESSIGKKSNSKQILPHNNCNQDFIKQTPIINTKSERSRSITPSRLTKEFSVTKISKNQKNEKNLCEKVKKLNNKESQAILSRACESLYERGLQKSKALEEKRAKRQHELEQRIAEEHTFKPKLNEVSEKIIEFRRETGTVPPRNPHKSREEMADLMYKELEECTFTPEINPISKIIVHNRESYLSEKEHFNELFNNTKSQIKEISQTKKKPLSELTDNLAFCNKKSKQYLLKQKEIEDKNLFKPKLNPKSIEQVKEPFFARLEKAIETKQKIKEGEYKSDEFTFQPQVGRSPFYQPLRGENSTSNKENIPVWEQLYRESQYRAKLKRKLEEDKSRNQLTNATSQPDFESLNHNESKNSLNITCVKTSTNLHYENLIQKRINTVFELLDSDEDGMISPNRIGIENLSKNTLIFLKPVFEEMDELDAELNYTEFKKAVINLLNDSDTYKKGLFLTDNKRNQNEFTFTPKINPKSKELAEGRNISQIHIGLYEQGVKNQKRKEMLIEREKAKKEEMELEECSFKPCLHLGRKEYHPSILDRKLSDIQFSVNQSSNSHLLESSLVKENYEHESY